MRHAPNDAREWLRYLSTITTWTPLREQLRTTAHALHLLPADLRADLIRASKRADLALVERHPDPGQ